MSLAEEKQTLRKAMRSVRRQFHLENGEEAAASLLELATSSPLFGGKKTISCFWPIQTEINTVPLIERLVKMGHRVCLPIVVGEAQPLIFREWLPTLEMIEGAFGAMTPPETSPALTPDLILSPLLAFDNLGFRLGYGGGFYDRSIEQIRKNQSLVTVGMAYSVQEVSDVPTETTDQKLDFLITEKEVIEFK